MGWPFLSSAVRAAAHKHRRITTKPLAISCCAQRVLWTIIRVHLCAFRPALLFACRMQILLLRAFVDGIAALAAMQRVAGRGFFQSVGRRRLPLFDVSLTANAFFILGGADGLAGQ